MTDIYLAGGENLTHQQILIAGGATRVAVNVTSLLRRRTSSWSLDLPFPDWDWVAYCDGPATDDQLAVVIDSASRPPKWVIGPPSWSHRENFIPLWNGEGEFPAERANGLVVTDRVFKSDTLVRRALASRSVGTVLGTISGSIDSDIGKFDLVISGSWWSSMKYGETQVWDGKKMHRYNADRKAEVRARHQAHIAALGIDVDQVMLEDADETARLAVVSWQRYEDHLSNAKVIPLTLRSSQDSEVCIPGESMAGESGSEGGVLDTRAPEARHRSVLPVVSMRTISATMRQGDGTEILEEQAVINTLSDAIRACDNCFLATSGCPGFQPGASCAYSIPVEIKSKDQLQGVLTAMVEIQTQRVLQARFAEEVTGQELTAEVGREMDRLFTSVEKMRDIMDNRDSVRMTVEARGRAGVLSRLFGDRVGENAKMLSHPVVSDEVMEAIIEDD